MAITVNIYEAKAQLFELIERAVSGEDIIIVDDKSGEMVKIVPVQKDEWKRPDPGIDKGNDLIYRPGFDDPLEEF